MKTVLRILNAAGGWHHGLSLRIENPPYMALVIEATDESGPCGLPTLSVCHYSEHNGDALRDPEMLFEWSQPLWLRPRLVPFAWRNDRLDTSDVSRWVEDTSYCFDPDRYDRHQYLAAVWDKCLAVQGYWTAFQRQRGPR